MEQMALISSVFKSILNGTFGESKYDFTYSSTLQQVLSGGF